MTPLSPGAIRALAQGYRRGYSIRTLAGVAGLSYWRVRVALIDAGVPLRPLAEPLPDDIRRKLVSE